MKVPECLSKEQKLKLCDIGLGVTVLKRKPLNLRELEELTNDVQCTAWYVILLKMLKIIN